LQTDKRRESSIDAHRRIVAAIEKHDRSKARSEMLRHIEQVEESVLSSSRPSKNESQKIAREREGFHDQARRDPLSGGNRLGQSLRQVRSGKMVL
jgi:hypothetical protein